MTPIPTPYDIIPPPGPLWSPSYTVWAFLLLCFVVVVVALFRRSRPTPRPEIAFSAELRRELSRMRGSTTSTDLIHAVQLAQRVFFFTTQIDLSAASLHELLQRANSPDFSELEGKMLLRLHAARELLYRPKTEDSGIASVIEELVQGSEALLYRAPTTGGSE